MNSQLIKTSSTTTAPTSRTRRSRGLSLETQSAYKFALAVVVGAAVIAVGMPIGVTALLMLAAVVIAARSLTVLAADPRSARSIRVREIAHFDGAMSAALAALAVGTAAAGADNAAVIAGAAAVVLAALRLGTRYAA